VTSSITAPGDTNPSDATVSYTVFGQVGVSNRYHQTMQQLVHTGRKNNKAKNLT